jgi:predicted phage terminase large subunit-like protein
VTAALKLPPLGPHIGPQEELAACSADIAWLGGAAGGGKSWIGIYELGRWAHVPGYNAIGFRRTTKQLKGLLREARKLYPLLGGRPREHPTIDFRFPSGAQVELSHLEHEHDAEHHQGLEYAVIFFDELAHFTEAQFWYLISRLRSTCGVQPYVRATLNPDPDHWTRKFLDWYIGEDGYAIEERSGVVRWFVRVDDEVHWADSRAELLLRFPTEDPKSFTFILARRVDNPTLLEADPHYVANLKAQQRVQRLRLLGDPDEEGRDRGGNWNARAGAGLYFRREWFKLVDAPPAKIIKSVRGWDKAASEETDEEPDPDRTEGVRMHLLENGAWYIDDVASTLGGPGTVLAFMKRTAVRDGREVKIAIWQDPGQAGVVDRDTTTSALHGFVVRSRVAAKSKLVYAEAWSPRVEEGRVYVKRAPWNERLFAQGQAFPDGAAHDDIIDAASCAFGFLKPGSFLLDDEYDRDLPRSRM